VEDTLVEFLEKGVGLESDIIANIKPLLPPEVAQQLEEIIPEAPNAAQPAAELAAVQGPPIMYTADNVASSQVGGWRLAGPGLGRLCCAGLGRPAPPRTALHCIGLHPAQNATLR
jgi:hypothetical protein